MSSNIDLKAIWQKQSVVAKPDVSEVIKRSGQLKKKALKKLIWTNVLLVVITIYYIAYLSLSRHPFMATTWIGATFMIIGFVAYLVVSNGLLMDLFKSHPETDSFAYLTELLAIKRKQELLQTKIIKLYLITISAGLALFMIETGIKLGILWGGIVYILLFSWIAFVYFYLTPRKVKRLQAEWNAVIDKLQAINNQLLLTKDME